MVDIKKELENSTRSSTVQDDRIELLQYERDIILDTYADDVLFILAR